ncbi:MAG: hypothetical protein HOE79_04005 [Euryarchaeota archaeon]|jgi:hypothetical protein|nr:hypothetical protein [Euryarchaeota archaeon]
MQGRAASIVLIFLLASIVSPLINYNENSEILSQQNIVKNSPSNISIAFSNGPNTNDDITGLHTLTFTLSGTGNISSILIEILDSGTWSTVTNLTGTPWLKHFDSTAYANGSYTLRATAWDDDVANNTSALSGQFNIVNHIPEITIFKVLNPDYGTGDSATDRAWFNIESDDAISFRWGAIDDDLKRATLSNAPGPGTPPADGPGTLAYGWDWASGDMSEGVSNPRLTVFDNSGLSNSSTIFIGIDRTGPTMGTISIGDGSAWQQSTSVTLSNLISASSDGQGSGVSHVEWSDDIGVTWNIVNTDSTTLTIDEGVHDIAIRAIDNVGNTGPSNTFTIKVDATDPDGDGWIVDELTTSKIGGANVSYVATDEQSGIDTTASYIQYGFDSNGVGQTPDLSGRWITLGTNGLDGIVGLENWATKSRQHLMLQAVVVDVAGNSVTTAPASYQILPGLDLYWNATETNLDRLVVRPGENFGNVTITSVLESNQDYGGSVIVRLESAPADRTSTVQWTVMESRTLATGSLSDSTETMIWNYTVPNSGQYDLRLVIDYADGIDEYDEGNNYNHMVVTGAAITSAGIVPSFAPSIIALLFAGIVISHLQRRSND